jgi:LCP family protein required for cell wall assembly
MVMNEQVKLKWWKRRWFKILAVAMTLIIIGGGIFLWKAGSALNRITSGGLFKNIASMVPGIGPSLKGEGDGRINVLLLGMRGENVPGGGTLADTIMVVSIKLNKDQPQDNKVSMISIPRDLYVDNPAWGNKTKINAVYAAGEENGKKQGLADMEKVVGNIAGIPIHYGVVINFAGFKQLVNAIGGVDITLAAPFDESMQFNEPHICDSFFTIPTGKFDTKTKKYFSQDTQTYKTRIIASYPLCSAPKETLECGGEFKLPAGKQTLNGDDALCYARSRTTSNDFERAKRQQLVIEAIKAKATSVGTLTDFSRINGVINSLGDNVRTDMQLGEMKDFLSLYQKMPSSTIINKVIDNSEGGLLYNPAEAKETGYILLPRGDNYNQIHEFFQNIFN